MILTGNLSEHTQKYPEHRMWFIGHFIKEPGEFKTENVEVKWGIHKKSEKKSKLTFNLKSKSLSILIKGRLVIYFQKLKKNIELSKIGDFVYWDPGEENMHTWEALAYTIILTIRWPSLKGDQKSLTESTGTK